MRISISKVSIICMALLSFIIASCMEKDLYNEADQTPSLATFSTTQDVKFVMNYSASAGFMASFDVYAENPIASVDNSTVELREGLKPVASGIAVSGVFNVTKKLPAYVTELYALSSALFAPQLMYAKVENGVATFQTMGIPETKAMSRGIAAGIIVPEVDFVPVMDAKHTPTPESHIEVPAFIQTAIGNAFPEGYKLKSQGKSVPAEYLREATLEVLEDAELWITPLVTGCSMTNTFGYVCYDGPKSDLANKTVKDMINEKTVVVFPFASLKDNHLLSDLTNLQKGDYFRLKYYNKTTGNYENTFPKGTTVIWFMYAGAYDRKSGTWTTKAQNKYYSNWAWNTSETDEFKPHTVYYGVRNGNTDYVCLGFEDQERHTNVSDHDFNDLIFMMKSNPATAIVPPVIIDDKGNKVSTDEERNGILAFEDCWPTEDDYDMNDVVLKYHSVATYVSETNVPTYVSKLNDIFTFIHNGAAFNNSFSIKYDFAPSAVESITINGTAANYRTDGAGFILDICKNVHTILQRDLPGQSVPYNIVINFKSGTVSQEAFQSKAAPYNPFISPKTGVEVHLPFYAPTTGADMTLFGTADDRSKPAENIYYVGREGSRYPFAIHLAGAAEFDIPTERLNIGISYTKYNNWVESGFSQNLDWYVK